MNGITLRATLFGSFMLFKHDHYLWIVNSIVIFCIGIYCLANHWFSLTLVLHEVKTLLLYPLAKIVHFQICFYFHFKFLNLNTQTKSLLNSNLNPKLVRHKLVWSSANTTPSAGRLKRFDDFGNLISSQNLYSFLLWSGFISMKTSLYSINRIIIFIIHFNCI